MKRLTMNEIYDELEKKGEKVNREWKNESSEDHYKSIIDKNGYKKMEHILIWENANGKIPKGMIIHHINGNKKDNRLQNLRLVNFNEHMAIHKSEKKLKKLTTFPIGLVFLLLLIISINAIPIINITSPYGNYNFLYSGQSFILNGTLNLFADSCWYNYNGTNISTACFGKYIGDLESNGQPLSSSAGGTTGKFGINITAKATKMIGSLKKSPNSDVTNCYIQNSAGLVTLAQGSFQGDYCYINFNMTNGVSYVLRADKNGSAYTNRFTTGVTIPVISTSFDWKNGIDSTGTDATTFYIFTDVGIVNNINYSVVNFTTTNRLIYYSNDSFNNIGNFTIDWTYNIFQNNVSYNRNTVSGAEESFRINLTTGSLLDNLQINYSGVYYPANSLISYGNNNYVGIFNLIMPQITTQQNKTFNFIATMNGTDYSTNINNQTINPFLIDNCTTFTNLILNYTLKDEDTQNIISDSFNTSTKVSLTVYNIDYQTIVGNISFQSTKNNTRVCLGDIGNNNYYIDVITEYDGGNDYITEFNNIQKQLINSTINTLNIDLFDLLASRSQEFLITFKDSNFLPADNVLVDVTRKYVDEGVFKSVEVAKTDAQGQTLTHLVLGDVIYTFVFKRNGEILAVLDNVLAKCNNIAIGDCQISTNAFSTSIPTQDFNFVNNLSVHESFDRSTRTITLIFTTLSGTGTVVLNVSKFDRFGNNTICSESLLSSSGTLNCVIPNSFGNSSIISQVFFNGLPVSFNSYTLQQSLNESDGNSNIIFLAIVIVVTLPLLFIRDIRGIMLGVFIGIFLIGTLLLINQGNLFSSVSALVYIIIAGIIILWKINSKEER